MDCRLKCEEPGKIKYTVTITAEAEQWEELRDQLHKAGFVWPANDLVRQIDDLLMQARKIYWPNVESSKPT